MRAAFSVLTYLMHLLPVIMHEFDPELAAFVSKCKVRRGGLGRVLTPSRSIGTNGTDYHKIPQKLLRFDWFQKRIDSVRSVSNSDFWKGEEKGLGAYFFVWEGTERPGQTGAKMASVDGLGHQLRTNAL